jgi:hypothetical protein
VVGGDSTILDSEGSAAAQGRSGRALIYSSVVKSGGVWGVCGVCFPVLDERGVGLFVSRRSIARSRSTSDVVCEADCVGEVSG